MADSAPASSEQGLLDDWNFYIAPDGITDLVPYAAIEYNDIDLVAMPTKLADRSAVIKPLKPWPTDSHEVALKVISIYAGLRSQHNLTPCALALLLRAE
jgi:hypothetical protein